MHVDAPDAAVGRLAAAQHGVFDRSQALDAGLSDKAVVHRLRSGRWFAVHRGVYSLQPALSPLGQDMAAVLACGPGAALASFNAAVLWNLLGRRTEVRRVVRPAPHRRAPDAVRLRHCADLPPTDITRRHGIPVTAPERTLLDLAADAAPKDLARAVNEALVRRLIRPGELRRRARGRRGAKALNALLDEGPVLTRSEAERLLLRVIDRAELPRPRTNVRVGGHEVDALWPGHRLAVEVDGYAFHAHRAAFERDRARDADLQAAGFRVIRTTWRQLADAPEALAARLGAALAATAPA